jgi:hypothetical protein
MSFAYHDNRQLKRLDADKLPPPCPADDNGNGTAEGFMMYGETQY